MKGSANSLPSFLDFKNWRTERKHIYELNWAQRWLGPPLGMAFVNESW
jgi:hypothetical protein